MTYVWLSKASGPLPFILQNKCGPDMMASESPLNSLWKASLTDTELYFGALSIYIFTEELSQGWCVFIWQEMAGLTLVLFTCLTSTLKLAALQPPRVISS